MTHKHTPAPWIVGDSGEGYNRYSITTLKPIAGQRGVMTIALCAGEANARLIAAAPELLAALERMEKYFGNVFPTKNEEALVLAARAAINKATGE